MSRPNTMTPAGHASPAHPFLHPSLVAVFGLWLVGCAPVLQEWVPDTDPNPGELRVDQLWRDGDLEQAGAVALEAATEGWAWAQLRMGIFYEEGLGVERDEAQAVIWYRKAAQQYEEKQTFDWLASVLDSDRTGHYRQWDDALSARFFLARHYAQGTGVPHDIRMAYLLANNVLNLSDGKTLEICGLDYRTLYREIEYAQCDVAQSQIRQLLAEINEAMTEPERREVRAQAEGWVAEEHLTDG